MSKPRITATSRVQRLLAMLQWAASHPGGVPVEQVCERFDIKPADLARELDLASMIGADSPNYDEMPFEVFVEDGLLYVRLFAFRRPMRLSPAEGLALVAAADVLVAREDATDGPGPLERALAKLAGLLGIEPGEAVDVELDPDGGEVGATIRRAMAQDRQLAFTYWTYGRDAIGDRTVDPWGLFADRGSWYLVAHAHDADATRHFRLDRMEALAVLDAPRTTTAPADLPTEVAVSQGLGEVVLDLAPGARWVAEAHPVLEVTERAGDLLRVRMAVAGPAWLERLLLRLGPEATVVEIDPALGDTDLAAQVARRVLARYRPEGGGGGPQGSR